MARFWLVSLTLGMSVIVPLASADAFESQCESQNDYGWPRFQSVKELQASPWATYFMNSYGELPRKFPVCTFDLHMLDAKAYIKANITGHKLTPQNELKVGDLFMQLDGYMIYHREWKALPPDTWTEIAHTAYPTELVGYWVWRTRGSGIWYNTGKTKVFPTPSNPAQIHMEAIQFLTDGCSLKPTAKWPRSESDIFGTCAREKGLDTLQFEPQEGANFTGTFGLAGLTEMVLVNIDGMYNCGVKDASKTPFRAGWLASRQCGCTNYETSDSCGLMPRASFPSSITGTDPPLCKRQAGPPFWNRWKACDPSTCKQTRCALPSATSNTLVV